MYLGNLSGLRDWGHARDYVLAQRMLLQQDMPENFVTVTGVEYFRNRAGRSRQGPDRAG